MGNSLSELLEEKGEEEQQQQQVKPKKQIIDVENLFYGEVVSEEENDYQDDNSEVKDYKTFREFAAYYEQNTLSPILKKMTSSRSRSRSISMITRGPPDEDDLIRNLNQTINFIAEVQTLTLQAEGNLSLKEVPSISMNCGLLTQPVNERQSSAELQETKETAQLLVDTLEGWRQYAPSLELKREREEIENNYSSRKSPGGYSQKKPQSSSNKFPNIANGSYVKPNIFKRNEPSKRTEANKRTQGPSTEKEMTLFDMLKSSKNNSRVENSFHSESPQKTEDSLNRELMDFKRQINEMTESETTPNEAFKFSRQRYGLENEDNTSPKFGAFESRTYQPDRGVGYDFQQIGNSYQRGGLSQSEQYASRGKSFLEDSDEDNSHKISRSGLYNNSYNIAPTFQPQTILKPQQMSLERPKAAGVKNSGFLESDDHEDNHYSYQPNNYKTEYNYQPKDYNYQASNFTQYPKTENSGFLTGDFSQPSNYNEQQHYQPQQQPFQPYAIRQPMDLNGIPSKPKKKGKKTGKKSKLIKGNNGGLGFLENDYGMSHSVPTQSYGQPHLTTSQYNYSPNGYPTNTSYEQPSYLQRTVSSQQSQQFLNNKSASYLGNSDLDPTGIADGHLSYNQKSNNYLHNSVQGPSGGFLLNDLDYPPQKMKSSVKSTKKTKKMNFLTEPNEEAQPRYNTPPRNMQNGSDNYYGQQSLSEVKKPRTNTTGLLYSSTQEVPPYQNNYSYQNAKRVANPNYNNYSQAQEPQNDIPLVPIPRKEKMNKSRYQEDNGANDVYSSQQFVSGPSRRYTKPYEM